MTATTPGQKPRQDGEGIGWTALTIYFLFMLALFIAFIIIGIRAIAPPV